MSIISLARLVVFLMMIISILSCNRKTVTITSEPSKADVYIGNEYAGKTPVKRDVKFPGKDPRTTKLTKDGHKDFQFKMGFYPKDTNKYNIILEKEDVKNVELVDFKPLQTDQGMRLQRTVKSSLAYLETIERSPNVKAPQKLTKNEKESIQIGGPVVSPDGKKLAYRQFAVDEEDRDNIEEIMEEGLADYQGGFSNIWLQPVDRYSKTRITFGQNMDLYPTFSPNGESIYFSSNRITDNPTIWQVNVEGGGGLTSITNSSAEDFAANVFPGNKLVTYTSIPPRAENPQIWKIKQSGTMPTQLREGQFPDVSPDGEHIVFTRKDRNTEVTRNDTVQFHPTQIWIMDKNGGSETQLTQNTDFNIQNPKFSPDGEWIVYASDEGEDLKGRHNYDIWMRRRDGTEQKQLTTNGSRDDNPVWSPDGKYIYFRSNRGGFWNIWRFEPIMPDD